MSLTVKEEAPPGPGGTTRDGVLLVEDEACVPCPMVDDEAILRGGGEEEDRGPRGKIGGGGNAMRP